VLRVDLLFNPNLIVTDSRGFLWSVSAGLGALSNPSVPPGPVYFTSSDCTGQGYLQANTVMPRVVFVLQGDATLRVIPDNEPVLALQMGSYLNGPPNCTVSNGLQYVFSLARSAPNPAITPPAQLNGLFQAPAHPEYVP
jgi:hypothetical protein